MSEQIVVGVDGSPASYTALRWALAHAGHTGAQVHAVRCWTPVVAKRWEAAVTGEPVPPESEQHARAKQELAQVVAAALEWVPDGAARVALRQSVVRAGRRDLVSQTSPEEVRIPAPSGWWAHFRALVGELRHAAPRSVHLVPRGGKDRPGYQLHHLVLDTAQTAALATKAAAGITVNDLLVAGLHLALDSWNRAHGGPSGRVSVLIPVNLRPKPSWYEVFGNFTFMVPVVTHPEDRSDPTATVATIRRRTRRIKDGCTPAAAVRFLDILQHLPHPAKRSIARLAVSPRVIPTAILSNLGRLDESLDFGPELPVREVWFSPPTRMPMGLALGAVTTGGRLHLVFRYRPRLFGPADAADFADRYLTALDQVAAHAHDGPHREARFIQRHRSATRRCCPLAPTDAPIPHPISGVKSVGE